MTALVYRILCLFFHLEQWGKRRLTTSGFAVILGIIISLVVGGDTRQSMAYQILAFLCSILSISILSSFFVKFRFTANRYLPRFVTVEVPVSYRVIIYNQTNKVQKGLKIREYIEDSLPSLAEFQEAVKSSPKKGNKLANFFNQWSRLVRQKRIVNLHVIDLPPLAPKSQTEVFLTFEPIRRGKVNFRGLIVTGADVFGLFNGCKILSLPQSCFILPKRYTLPPVALPGSRKYQSGGVALASSVGDSEEFVSLREYRPGDPLRKIHWKSWAKVGKPIVREEEEEFFVRHALILDTFVSEPYSEILEESVSLAASFACQLQTQESLLDLIFVGTQAYCFTSGRGLGDVEQILEILAAVAPCGDKSFENLSSLVITRASLLSGCICLLLTWDEPRQALVNYLQQLRLPMLIFVITHPSAQLTLEKPIENFYRLNLGQIQLELSNIPRMG